MKHFLLEKGAWQGAGLVTFSHSSQSLPFFVRWDIEEKDTTLIALQRVTLEGMETRENRYFILPLREGLFSFLLSNDMVNECRGQGRFDEKKIEWPVLFPDVFDGQESFERVSDIEYRFAAEYGKSGGLITKISGMMKKATCM